MYVPRYGSLQDWVRHGEGMREEVAEEITTVVMCQIAEWKAYYIRPCRVTLIRFKWHVLPLRFASPHVFSDPFARNTLKYTQAAQIHSSSTAVLEEQPEYHWQE